MLKIPEPHCFRGNLHSDKRGVLSYFNEIDLSPVKRMYIIQPVKGITRAWQGHQFESKWFFILSGSAEIQLAPLKEKSKPSIKWILSQDEQAGCFIPGGYFNGFKALKKETKLLVLSNATLEESIKDDYRKRIDEIQWI